MADERNVVVDRFACGCFLFALFSRSIGGLTYVVFMDSLQISWRWTAR